MADKATQKVNAAIGEQKATNAKSLNDALALYSKMIREYDTQYHSTKLDYAESADEARGRLNNTMASRGIAVGESAGANFARADKVTNDKLGELYQSFRNSNASAVDQLKDRQGQISEANRLLDVGRPWQIEELRSQYAAAEMDRKYKQAQIDAMNAPQGGSGGGSGEADTTSLKFKNEFMTAAAGGATEAQLRSYAAANGYDYDELVALGLVPSDSVAGRASSVSKMQPYQQKGINLMDSSFAKFGATAKQSPSYAGDFWRNIGSAYGTPMTQNPGSGSWWSRQTLPGYGPFRLLNLLFNSNKKF